MGTVGLQDRIDAVSALLEERLRLKGGTLDDKLRRAGRRLPAKVRAAGAVLVQAEAMMPVPKLMQQIDTTAVTAAHDLCVRHLATVNPGAARTNILLNLLASVAFSLLVVGLLVLVVAYLRGLI